MILYWQNLVTVGCLRCPLVEDWSANIEPDVGECLSQILKLFKKQGLPVNASVFFFFFFFFPLKETGSIVFFIFIFFFQDSSTLQAINQFIL